MKVRSLPWKAEVLPLHNARLSNQCIFHCALMVKPRRLIVAASRSIWPPGEPIAHEFRGPLSAQSGPCSVCPKWRHNPR